MKQDQIPVSKYFFVSLYLYFHFVKILKQTATLTNAMTRAFPSITHFPFFTLNDLQYDRNKLRVISFQIIPRNLASKEHQPQYQTKRIHSFLSGDRHRKDKLHINV